MQSEPAGCTLIADCCVLLKTAPPQPEFCRLVRQQEELMGPPAPRSFVTVAVHGASQIRAASLSADLIQESILFRRQAVQWHRRADACLLGRLKLYTVAGALRFRADPIVRQPISQRSLLIHRGDEQRGRRLSSPAGGIVCRAEPNGSLNEHSRLTPGNRNKTRHRAGITR